ncbi:ABC transporter permease [Clostridium neuense]|uniref:ABC transporter permease n=1 Tax=Clostridium neuense TaxID=1728934 RepID=A0ABW8T9T1_9CLOT
MKPLGTINYLKNNAKKVLVQFICVVLSTCFIYLISVVFYSSIYSTNSYGINIVKNAFIVKTNHKKEIPLEALNSLKSNKDVRKIIPLVSAEEGFQYNSMLTTSDGNVFNVFQEDLKDIINLFNMRLISGRLPRENSNEIVIPKNFAKQNKIDIGAYIGNDEKLNISLDNDYKVVGIMDGSSSFMLISNHIKISRNEALKHNIIAALKSDKQNEVEKIFSNIKDKNIKYFDYRLLKSQTDEAYKNINIVEAALDGLIIFVLCISIMHINYVILLSRKKEFVILNLIGYTKNKLYKKILKENATLNILSFGAGNLIAFFIANILNITLWGPKGEYSVPFKLTYVFNTSIILICIFIVEVLLLFVIGNKLYKKMKL